MSKLRPLNNDVMLKKVKETHSAGGIVLLPNKQADDGPAKFEVVEVAEGVTAVAPGDIVLVHWTRITPPFDASDIDDGYDQKIGVTDVKEILAVIG